MNTVDFESPVSSSEARENANASSIFTVAKVKHQATTGSLASEGADEDSPSDSLNSASAPSQGAVKVFAPVLTHDVALPNTTRKVPMVMVPVPDSRTLMAIPMSTLSQLKDSPANTLQDQKQARDLLVWSDGVGTLDGCDLRFKINQLGCLELLDSDDESENINMNLPKQNAISTTTDLASNNITISKTTNGLFEAVPSIDRHKKKVKLDSEPTPIRQISPGSSLLRDGPNMRRSKSASNSSINFSSRSQANALSLLKKIEHNQNSLLLDKLVSRQRVDEIKTNVEQWTIEDVKKFVDSIPGCSGHGELFELQQICGKSLMYLDQRDLLDVINVKLGPAVKIYHAISLLK